jgi:peptidase E
MQILAIGGGGFRGDERGRMRPGPLVEHALDLTGAQAPRVCALFTATGDGSDRIAPWYSVWAETDVRASHLTLFPMPNHDDVRAHLLAQDAIFVSGGSVVNLLACWRAHGLHEVFREIAASDTVLFGVSAGMLCWFDGGVTDSFGPELASFDGGVGIVPHSGCPHYSSEERRRPTFQALVGSGKLPAGWAADDGVGLHLRGSPGAAELVEVVSERDGAAAWWVEPDGSGGASERRIEARRLPDPATG